jgi:hypothetical protein
MNNDECIHRCSSLFIVVPAVPGAALILPNGSRTKLQDEKGYCPAIQDVVRK